MRMRLAALALAALPAALAAQGLPDSTRIGINRVFAAWSATNSPGCAVGVARNGAVIFQNGYGMANLELDVPITPGSIFHVASVSKQFTAMAVMLLAADGKLYFTAEEGEVRVVKAGPEFELLAVNPMGDVCMATPAISEGMLLVRTRKNLVCIATAD